MPKSTNKTVASPPGRNPFVGIVVGLVILVCIGVAAAKGLSALFSSGVSSVVNSCASAEAKVKQQDKAAQATLSSIQVAGAQPSLQSYSNPDCVDGGTVLVVATYKASGTVDTARVAVRQALAGTMPSTTQPAVSQDDTNGDGDIASVSESFPVQGNNYRVTYQLAIPFSCPGAARTCAYQPKAYETYGLESQAVSTVRLAISNYKQP